MSSGGEAATDGKLLQLGRTLRAPQPLTWPHPPILIGGGGEKKTLRLVAQYADACNLFPTPDLQHKLDVLREHCERRRPRLRRRSRRPSCSTFDLGPDGENVDAILQRLRELADMGFQVAHGRVVNVYDPKNLELIGERIVPVVADW